MQPMQPIISQRCWPCRPLAVSSHACPADAAAPVGQAAASSSTRRSSRASVAASTSQESSPRLVGALSVLAWALQSRRRTAKCFRQLRTALRAAAGEPDLAPLPVALLGGFLGAGKTTLLKHVLEQSEGLRVGVLVNDVGAINIDVQLVRNRFGTAPDKGTGGEHGASIETVELTNGCVCCSLGEELFGSLDMLLSREDPGQPFDYVVVELSGVAEPKGVLNNFRILRRGASGPAVTRLAGGLPRVLTVVDSSTFCGDWMAKDRMESRPELLTEGDLHKPGEAIAPGIWDCRGPASLRVAQLLVEQVEGAKVVVLNKADMASELELETVRAAVSSINPKAEVLTTSFGKVSAASLLASRPEAHEEVQARGASTAQATLARSAFKGSPLGASSVQATLARRALMLDSADSPASSEQPGTPANADQAQKYGIDSFTYVARRPFRVPRLLTFLQETPFPRADALSLQPLEEMASAQPEESAGEKAKDAESQCFWGVLRSKGFCWVDERPEDLMLWSFAGRSFSMETIGRWWACLPAGAMDEAFNVASSEGGKALRDALTEEMSHEYGDRRQELVFIGQGMDEQNIRAGLNDCLLTDEELKVFWERVAEL